jgi:hypothetical protein
MESLAGHDFDRERDRDREGTRRGEGMTMESLSLIADLFNLRTTALDVSHLPVQKEERHEHFGQRELICTDGYGHGFRVGSLLRMN